MCDLLGVSVARKMCLFVCHGNVDRLMFAVVLSHFQLLIVDFSLLITEEPAEPEPEAS
jgi:hypothetical protein